MIYRIMTQYAQQSQILYVEADDVENAVDKAKALPNVQSAKHYVTERVIPEHCNIDIA